MVLLAHARIEQYRGKFSIARALLPAVEGTEHQDKTAALLNCERRDGWRLQARQALPELQGCLEALRKIGFKASGIGKPNLHRREGDLG